MKPEASPSENFIRRLTTHQSHLMGYIMASLGSYANAADVLQETNVVLWQKSGELRDLDEFLPWALTVARYKVLIFIRDSSRERLVFSPEVTEALSAIALTGAEQTPERLEALRECLGSLPESKLAVLRERYGQNRPLQQIASDTGTPLGTLKNQLRRIRGLLSDCIGRRTSTVSRPI